MHAVHDGLLLCMLWQSGVSFLPDHAMLIIWQCTLTCEVGAMALKSNAWTILFPNQRLCRHLPVSRISRLIFILLVRFGDISIFILVGCPRIFENIGALVLFKSVRSELSSGNLTSAVVSDTPDCRPLLKIASQCGVSPSFVFLPQMHPTRGRSDLCSDANDGSLVRQSFPGSCYAASIAPGSCSSSNSRGLPFELAGTEKLARSFVSFSLGCFWMALKAYVLPVPSAADGAIGAQTFGRPCGLWTPRMHGIADRRSSMAPTCDLYDHVSSAWWHLSNMELKTKQSRPACLGCPKVPAQQPLRDSSRPVRPYETNVAFLNSCQCSLSLWSQWHKIETICASQYFSKKTS